MMQKLNNIKVLISLFILSKIISSHLRRYLTFHGNIRGGTNTLKHYAHQPAVWIVTATSLQVKVGVGLDQLSVYPTLHTFFRSTTYILRQVRRALQAPGTVARAVKPEAVALKRRSGITYNQTERSDVLRQNRLKDDSLTAQRTSLTSFT